MGRNVRSRAIFMLLLATAAWGYSFPGGKALLAALDGASGRSAWFFSALMISTRFALARCSCSQCGRARLRRCVRRNGGRESPWDLRGLGMLLQADGLRYTTASAVAFLTQFTAVLVPIYCVLARSALALRADDPLRRHGRDRRGDSRSVRLAGAALRAR
jgi:hypothetical protein